MSCKDYQQYIQQWFNYVLDAHVARCESCSAFFLQLTETTANDLERLQAIHALAAHAAAEAQEEFAQAQSAAPSAVQSTPEHVAAHAGQGTHSAQAQGGPAAGQPPVQSPAYNQIGVIQPAPGQTPVAQNPQGQAAQGQPVVENQAQPQVASNQPVPTVAQQVQQSPPSQPFPKVAKIAPEAIPRLAPTEGIDNSTVGRLFEIGKFILSDDDRDILKRMTSDEPHRSGVKILSHRDSESLQSVLGQVSRLNTVVGWVIISNDGLLIYSTLPEHFDAENIAVRALSIFMGSEDSSEKCGFGQLRQVVMRTAIGTNIISNFSGGLFITVATANDADAVVELIQQIRAVT